MKKTAILLALFATSPALAQTAATPTMPTDPAVAATPPTTTAPATPAPGGSMVTATTAATPAAKPKLICQETETLGSRLGGHKVCMTREQWRAQAAEDRMAVDRAQLSRGSTGH